MIKIRGLSNLAKHIVAPTMIGSGNLAASLIRALFWFTIASIIDTENYGQVNYYIAIATTLGTLSLLGLNSTMITYLAKGNEIILRQANLLVLISSSVAAVGVVLFLNHLPTAFLLLTANFFAMTVDEYLGRRNYKRYSILAIINSGSQFTLALSLYFMMGINGIIIGYALPSLALGYRIFSTLDRKSLSFNEIRPRISFTINAYSIAVSQSLATYADKLVIASMFGFTVLGLYQLSSQFLIFLSIIPASLYRYLLPEEASGMERRTVKKIGMIIAVALAIISFFVIPDIIIALFPRFVDAIPAARVMVFGIVPLTINSILNSRFLGRERSRPVLIGSAVYIAILTISLYTLGNLIGITGLALSVIISLSFQSLSLWLLTFQNRSAPSS